MFFKMTLTHTIQITPDHLSANIKRFVENYIKKKTGYNKDYECVVICVLEVKNYKSLRIAEGTGNVVFGVEYEAIVQKLISKEVVDARVSNVNEDGIVACVGAFKNVHISSTKISDFRYDPNTTSYSDAENNKLSIKKDSKIRIKLDVVNYNVNGMTVMGSIDRSFSLFDN